MKTLFSFLVSVTLIATSLLGGCHTAVRDPGSLAKACANGIGHFECQVETIIDRILRTYDGTDEPKPEMRLDKSIRTLTGVEVVYACGLLHYITTPYGTYDAKFKDSYSVKGHSSHVLPESTLVKHIDFQHIVKIPCSEGVLRYQILEMNGYPIPPVTRSTVPTPQPEP
jgi:hypothetical protein